MRDELKGEISIVLTIGEENAKVNLSDSTLPQTLFSHNPTQSDGPRPLIDSNRRKVQIGEGIRGLLLAMAATDVLNRWGRVSTQN